MSSTIYSRRRNLKVSQEEVAQKLRITRKTYGTKELEPERFTIWELNKLSQVLNMTAGELLENAVKEI